MVKCLSTYRENGEKRFFHIFFVKMKNICMEKSKGKPGKCRETTKEEIGNGI